MISKNLNFYYCLLFFILLLCNNAFAQEQDWDNWNDLGGFEDFPSFEDENKPPTKSEDITIDLPVPTEVDKSNDEINLKIETKASELQVKKPEKLPDIELSGKTPEEKVINGEDNKTTSTPQNNTTTQAEKKTDKPKKKKTATKTKKRVKEVVLKEKGTKEKSIASKNRRHVNNDVKYNTKISDFMERDEEIEDLYESSSRQFTRPVFDNKIKPNQFFVNNRNETNSHLPRTVYQKEFSQLLFSAIEKEDIGALKALIANGANINSKILATGYSTVNYAVKKNKIRALRYLITKGADLNSRDNNGKTPLHLAISEGKVNIFNILIASGADPFIKDKSGKYPIDYSTTSLKSTFNTSIARVSINKNKTLIEFSKKGAVSAMAELINSGALVDAQDEMGETALMKAIKNNHLKSVLYLLSQGANPLLKNKLGQSSLDFARKSSVSKIYSIIDTVVIRSELESGISRNIEEKIHTTNPVLHNESVDKTKFRENNNAFTIIDTNESIDNESFFEKITNNISDTFHNIGDEEASSSLNQINSSGNKVEYLDSGIIKRTAKKVEYNINEDSDDISDTGVVNSINRFLDALNSKEGHKPLNQNSNRNFTGTVDLVPDDIN